jgi:hypothetical protein
MNKSRHYKRKPQKLDSYNDPRKGEVSTCLRFWFLNPSACQVYLHCKVYHVISYSCLAFYFRNHLFYPPYFLLLSWETFVGTIWGWQKKHIRLLLYCFGISKHLSLRSGLLLPYMLGGVCAFIFIEHVFIFFSVYFLFWHTHTHADIYIIIRGEDAEFLYFLLIVFQILHVFLPDISIHCALIEYAYIWLRVYASYLRSFPEHLNAR